MNLKEQKVKELAANHGEVPIDLLARAVDENGIVDNALLGATLQAFAAGKAGRAAQNQAQIDALYRHLAEAKRRNDVVTMVACKSRLFGLGADPNINLES